MDQHILQTLLQLHLASDSQAVLHAPFILACVTSSALAPSPHLSKWLTRIHALMQSKDPGVAWAGLSFALKTSFISKSLMIQSAHSWLSIALPIVARNEPVPVLKAAIRFIRTIFSKALDTPEFQRQVCQPNVPKFSEILVSIVQKTASLELKIFGIDTLSHLISLYPSLHRQFQSTLSNMCLGLLNNGNSTISIPHELLSSASRCYSVLHITGGKVAAATSWRKSLEETMGTSWSALHTLQSTFLSDQPTKMDPVFDIPLNLERLRSCLTVFDNLFSSISQRPIQVPLGALTHLATGLLSCTAISQDERYMFDPSRRCLEIASLSSIWLLGCQLITLLMTYFGSHMTPYTPKLLASILFHLESQPTSILKAAFLDATSTVLAKACIVSSEIPLNRIMRVILPGLASLLSGRVESHSLGEAAETGGSSSKGKKRAKTYEGAELLSRDQDIVCPTMSDCEAILSSLKVLNLVLCNPQLEPGLQSLSARLTVSLMLELPRVPPSTLSLDPGFHKNVLGHVTSICQGFTYSTNSILSKVLPLLLRQPTEEEVVKDGMELMVHPRLPPLVKSMPQLENLSLLQAEESHEEAEARVSMFTTSLATDDVPLEPQTPNEDVVMGESAVLPTVPRDNLLTSMPRTISMPARTPEIAHETAAASHSPDPVPWTAPVHTRAPDDTAMPQVSNSDDEDDAAEGEGNEMPQIDVDSDSD